MPSPLDKPVPPQGEEIHLPGGSLQPLALSVGITLALLGVTITPVLCVIGGVICVAALYTWIRDAKREFDHLPADHGHVGHGSAETGFVDHVDRGTAGH